MQEDNQSQPETWVSRLKAVARTSAGGVKEVLTSSPTLLFDRLMSVPSAIAGNGHGDIAGYSEIYQKQLEEMRDVLEKLKNFNTTSGMKDEDLNQRIDHIEFDRVSRLRIAEKILKMDEEERKKEEEKLNKRRMALKDESDNLGKENANAIIGRILTSLVGLDVLDVLDIAFSMLENFVNTDFSSGVKNLVADEKVSGPFAKMAHDLRVDEFAGLLAKFPIIGDVNHGFTEFANSDYVSPFSSIIGQTMQSEAANLLFRGLVVVRALSQEVELSGRYKELQEKLDSEIPKMDSYIKDSVNKHIEKMAPRIIELETRDELRYISFKTFLEDEGTQLNTIFSNELLNRKMRNADGKDSATSIKQYLENLRDSNASDLTKEVMRDFANNPQNHEIIETILNVVNYKYSLTQNDKKEFLEKIIKDQDLGILQDKFLVGDVEKSFTPQVYQGIKEGLNQGKNLSEAIMGLDNNQIDDAIIGVAKIVKKDEKVLKIKTTTPQQISAEESKATWVQKLAGDSVDENAGARARARAL